MPIALADSVHSSGVKVVEAGPTAKDYLESQGDTLVDFGRVTGEGGLPSQNTDFAVAMSALEDMLNTEVACDVACGVVNVLTVKAAPPVGESTVEFGRVRGTMRRIQFDAFWDPDQVGVPLPLTSNNGDALYTASKESAVGVEGRGTVLDAGLRRSHELLLAEYEKGVAKYLKFNSLESPRRELLTSVSNTLSGTPNVRPCIGNPTSLSLPPAILQFQFPSCLEDIRRKLCPLAPRIRVVPYKIVTYANGDYFLPHVDSMDHNALQFGSLALQLPYTYPDDDLEEGHHSALTPNGTPRKFQNTDGSIASGELVFYLGRDVTTSSATDNFKGDTKFRNRTWTNYERPMGDKEQLRMRVDLTETLPRHTVDRERVNTWLSREGQGGGEGERAATTEGVSAAANPPTREYCVQPLKYAAWQGDIPHEVTKVTCNYRTVVLYRLVKVFDGNKGTILTANTMANPSSSSNHPDPPLSFLSAQSRCALANFSSESEISPIPLPLHDDKPPSSSSSSVWARFLAQTSALQSLSGVSYSSLVAPDVRNAIHGAIANVVKYFIRTPPKLPSRRNGNGTRSLHYVVDVLRAAPEDTAAPDATDGPITHLGFFLRHQYATAVQRVLHELQTPSSPHAQSLTRGTRRRMIIALLKGADAVLYTLLTEIGEVSIHATHQLRSDQPSAPYRKTSSSKSTEFGKWVERVFPTPVTLASEHTVDASLSNTTGLELFEKRFNLNAEFAGDDVEKIYPSIVDCVWITMGLGRLLGGGLVTGNADCGCDWWYRSSIFVFNPRRTTPIFWRHRLLLLALQRGHGQDTTTSTDDGDVDDVDPVVLILRRLLSTPDVFGYVASFL